MPEFATGGIVNPKGAFIDRPGYVIPLTSMKLALHIADMIEDILRQRGIEPADIENICLQIRQEVGLARNSDDGTEVV